MPRCQRESALGNYFPLLRADQGDRPAQRAHNVAARRERTITHERDQNCRIRPLMRQSPSSVENKWWSTFLTLEKDGGNSNPDTSLGSFGERARGRPERNGPCISRGYA